MRILLLGKNGQIGWELQRLLPSLGEVEAFDIPEVEFARPEELHAFLGRGTWDLIVNAAAYTAVDKAESEPAAAMAVNGIAPGVLAEAAAAMGAGLVHYSTDYVFDGTKGAPYREDDPPAPLNVYGSTKLEGDRRVAAAGGAHLILRTSWVYGARGHNFFLTVRRLARQQAKLRIVADQTGCPTWCRSLAEATVHILSSVLRGPGGTFAEKLGDRKGIYNCSSEGETSWFAFAKAVLASDPGRGEHIVRELVPVRTEEYPTPARRPPYSVLSKEKIRRVFGLSIPAWREQLADCVNSMGQAQGA
jgi:dTDP-4-dehydrorhamnose reductase